MVSFKTSSLNLDMDSGADLKGIPVNLLSPKKFWMNPRSEKGSSPWILKMKKNSLNQTRDKQ